jgi:hypothetical protein
MDKKLLVIFLLILLAACTTAPTPVVVVPTQAVLPSVTMTMQPSATMTAAPSVTITLAPTVSETPPPTPLETMTFTASPTGTNTPTPSPTFTETPSLTITNTITPTPSPTFTASPELDSLGMLAMLSLRATVLPPEQRYNPQTLTAVAFAAQTLIAGGDFGLGSSPTPVLGTPALGTPALATLPPVVCTVPPPGGLGSAFAADPTLAQAVGCPFGSVFSTTTAIQSFERGAMVYVEGSPKYIYVLTLDGRFRRFNDTFVEGVDPETGGETPPLGLLEPRRGFLKVWRNNFDVRAALGWGITEEQGNTSSVQTFDRGRAIYLPQRGETYLLIDDPGGASGSWRALPVSF